MLNAVESFEFSLRADAQDVGFLESIEDGQSGGEGLDCGIISGMRKSFFFSFTNLTVTTAPRSTGRHTYNPRLNMILYCHQSK